MYDSDYRIFGCIINGRDSEWQRNSPLAEIISMLLNHGMLRFSAQGELHCYSSLPYARSRFCLCVLMVYPMDFIKRIRVYFVNILLKTIGLF